MIVTGFSSDKTSEYTVLNDLYTMYVSQFSFFYPLYYHINRNDTAISLLDDTSDLNLVVCFAKRPKTDYIGSNKSVITFRNSILKHVEIFADLGLSVIMGAPLGTSIKSIGFGSQCQWFHIKSNIELQECDYVFYNGIADSKYLVNGIEMLDRSNLLKLLQKSEKYRWVEILVIIKEWYQKYKNQYCPYSIWGSISGVKPVFVVYKL